MRPVNMCIPYSLMESSLIATDAVTVYNITSPQETVAHIASVYVLRQDKCKKTYQFKTHCKDDVMISLH